MRMGSNLLPLEASDKRGGTTVEGGRVHPTTANPNPGERLEDGVGASTPNHCEESHPGRYPVSQLTSTVASLRQRGPGEGGTLHPTCLGRRGRLRTNPGGRCDGISVFATYGVDSGSGGYTESGNEHCYGMIEAESRIRTRSVQRARRLTPRVSCITPS